jgi:hypothetical protein
MRWWRVHSVPPMLEGVFTTAGGDTAEGRAAVEQQYTNLIPTLPVTP